MKKHPNWKKTNSLVTGDVIVWKEGVFKKPYEKGDKPIGNRTNCGKIVKESYGKAKQQHTFTVEIIKSQGLEPHEIGKRICRKGRNLYFDCKRRLWDNEADRKKVEMEKFKRGNKARKARDERKSLTRQNTL